MAQTTHGEQIHNCQGVSDNFEVEKSCPRLLLPEMAWDFAPGAQGAGRARQIERIDARNREANAQSNLGGDLEPLV